MPISQAYLGSAELPSGIKSFYFIRHGTTDLNEKEMVVNGEKHWGVQGSGTNIGLNEKGYARLCWPAMFFGPFQ
nr:hypothetical protein K4M19_00302 [Agrobacterium fabrum]